MHMDSLALAVLLAGILGFMYRHNRFRLKAERAAMFDTCLPLLDSFEISQDDVNFPVLSGIYQGHEVHVEAVLDHVGYRKLPSLWLLVTVKRDLALRTTLDVLVRPQNVEFFSPSEHLAESPPMPEGWPEHAVIKVDRLEQSLPLEVMEPHVLAFFSDPRAKEMVVTPRGARIVYQINQVERGEYLVLRGLKIGSVAVAAPLFRALLDRATSLCRDLVLTYPQPPECANEKCG
jgi:hypothetical protein